MMTEVINLVNAMDLNCVGYVIEETQFTFTVKFDGNKVVVVKRVFFIDGSYRYSDEMPVGNEYKITCYSPLRMKVFVSGRLSYSLNRIFIDKENNIVYNV